jgi:hypothetical protein
MRDHGQLADSQLVSQQVLSVVPYFVSVIAWSQGLNLCDCLLDLLQSVECRFVVVVIFYLSV